MCAAGRCRNPRDGEGVLTGLSVRCPCGCACKHAHPHGRRPGLFMKADCSALRAPAIAACIRIPGCRPACSYRLARPMSMWLCMQACPSTWPPSGAVYESRLLRTACSRNRRLYSYSGLSPCMLIQACPSDVHVAVHASMPIHMAAVRGFHSK